MVLSHRAAQAQAGFGDTFVMVHRIGAFRGEHHPRAGVKAARQAPLHLPLLPLAEPKRQA